MPGAEAVAARAPEERIAWIDRRLDRTADRAGVWLHVWEGAIVGATAIDLALIPVLGDTRNVRIDFGLGAATTVIGLVPLWVWPPRVLEESAALDLELARGDADRCARVADAERRLVAVAAAEEEQRAWPMQTANVVLNLGVTLLFGAFHRWTSGIANGIAGALVGEAIIYTEPVDQIEELARYRRGDLDEPAGTARARWQLRPTAGAHGVGLTLAYGGW